MRISKPRIIFVVLSSLLLASPVLLQTWELTPEGLKMVSIQPSNPVSPPYQVDLTNDGKPEGISLAGGIASIITNDEVIWQSPDAWQVVQAEFTDIDGDDSPEVTLIIWRSFSPWPVDYWLPHGGRISDFHNSEGLSCHLILIGWRQGKFDEIWAGSALAEPVLEFTAADLNGDGDQELLTLEGNYDGIDLRPANAFKVWEWNGFGFTVVSSLTGTYLNMQPVHSLDGLAQIVLESRTYPKRSKP